jgi:hypothetical protein
VNTPESAALSSDPNELWTVYRQDDNGNVFVVADNVSREEAERLVALYESRGHKQSYSAQRK